MFESLTHKRTIKKLLNQNNLTRLEAYIENQVRNQITDLAELLDTISVRYAGNKPRDEKLLNLIEDCDLSSEHFRLKLAEEYLQTQTTVLNQGKSSCFIVH